MHKLEKKVNKAIEKIMNIDFNVGSSFFSMPSQVVENKNKFTAIRAEAANSALNETLTSALKITFIKASLENDIIKDIHSAVSMKIFFDINYDGKILKKDYLIKSVENTKLEIKDLFSIFESIFIKVEESLKDDSGKDLDVKYTAFIKYDYPQVKFKILSAYISNNFLEDSFTIVYQDKIKRTIENYLHLNQRKIEPHINDNLEFI
ncbi:MAG: hypothetical protein H0W50_09605 [Parachlamydiaceae bacterium]|nr:hypothetical protein [Parachlamydiaceae bacterium]